MVKNIDSNIPNIKMPAQLVTKHLANISQNSVSCLWEQSFRCPCVDVVSNSPKSNCSICHGQGYIFSEPYELSISITGDSNSQYDGRYTQNYLPATFGTPQVTETGIEDGIKPGDRITVSDWYVPQNYIFNVTKQRLNGGVYLPYKCSTIDSAFTIADDGTLQQLTVGTDISLEDNFVKVLTDSLLNKNITLSISIEKRYYVSMLIKDLRYSKQRRANQKEAATGYGNNFLTYSQLLNGEVQYNGNQIFKMPNKLMLRRETLFFSDSNLVANETDNNLVISDPKVTSFNEFMGGV